MGHTPPLGTSERFEYEVLNDPVVREDASVQLALTFWQKDACTLERALLAAVRALAREKRALQGKVARLQRQLEDRR